MSNPDVGPRCPACRMGLVTHEPADPQCIGHRTQEYSCVTHGYSTRTRNEIVKHVDNHAGCKMHVEELPAIPFRSQE